MRIVGGQFRGRALASVGKGDAAAHLRPTTDRVREALFNALSHRADFDFDGARVLDLFAGTGALGLEAMSRGAAYALFVDNGAKARGLIRENVALLGVGDASDTLRRDAARLGPCSGARFTCVFADPPYGMGLAPKALIAVAQGGWLDLGALVVVEENASVALPLGFELLDERSYGDTAVTIGRFIGAP